MTLPYPATLIVSDAEHGIPVRHPDMVALGRHYGCTVATCRPFDPLLTG
jgi:hypothetical protein